MIPYTHGANALRPLGRLLVATIVATSLLAACGSDDDDSAESAAPAESAASEATEEGEEGEYEIVSDSAVAQGYATMLALMTKLAADPSTADAAALEEVHSSWESFEGTVKQNDADTYLASEEALDAFLEAGADADGAAMTEATAKMSTTADAYLATHPG